MPNETQYPKTYYQRELLSLLGEYGYTRADSAAFIMGTTKGGITRLITQLEQQGFVTSAVNEYGRVTWLTPQGERAAHALMAQEDHNEVHVSLLSWLDRCGAELDAIDRNLQPHLDEPVLACGHAESIPAELGRYRNLTDWCMTDHVIVGRNEGQRGVTYPMRRRRNPSAAAA